MKVYIAAPLFSEGERQFNERIDTIIRSCGHETFLSLREMEGVWQICRMR